jgi:hypothetical protein
MGYSKLENIKKIKYHDPNGGQKTIYKVTTFSKYNLKTVVKDIIIYESL